MACCAIPMSHDPVSRAMWRRASLAMKRFLEAARPRQRRRDHQARPRDVDQHAPHAVVQNVTAPGVFRNGTPKRTCRESGSRPWRRRLMAGHRAGASLLQASPRSRRTVAGRSQWLMVLLLCGCRVIRFWHRSSGFAHGWRAGLYSMPGPSHPGRSTCRSACNRAGHSLRQAAERIYRAAGGTSRRMGRGRILGRMSRTIGSFLVRMLRRDNANSTSRPSVYVQGNRARPKPEISDLLPFR